MNPIEVYSEDDESDSALEITKEPRKMEDVVEVIYSAPQFY